MVNENHFRFDRKSFFNFWKTIYGFKNCKSFPKLNSSSFYARLMSDCRNPATSGHRRQMSMDQIPAMVRSRSDLAKMAGIRPDLTGFGQNGWDSATDPTGSDRIRRSPVGIRLRRPDFAEFRQQLHFRLS
jgi:hypothetical protein